MEFITASREVHSQPYPETNLAKVFDLISKARQDIPSSSQKLRVHKEDSVGFSVSAKGDLLLNDQFIMCHKNPYEKAKIGSLDGDLVVFVDTSNLGLFDLYHVPADSEKAIHYLINGRDFKPPHLVEYSC